MDVHIWHQQWLLQLHGYYPVNVSIGLGICLHMKCVLDQQHSSHHSLLLMFIYRILFIFLKCCFLYYLQLSTVVILVLPQMDDALPLVQPTTL